MTCSLRDFTSFQWGLAVTLSIYLYGAAKQQKVKEKKEKKNSQERKVEKLAIRACGDPVCVKMCSPYTEEGHFLPKFLFHLTFVPLS